MFTGTATNAYTRELHGTERQDLTWLTFFRTISNSVILSLQMSELCFILLFKANILSFLYSYSKLAMPYENI